MIELRTIVSYLVLIVTTVPLLIVASKEKLIEDNLNGLIAGLGDFDSDKFTDIFIITENGKSLELLKGYPTEPVLRKWPSIKCTFNQSQDIIVGVIASDFTGKAMMDVLVVTNPSLKSDGQVFNIWLFKGNINSLECSNTTKPLVPNVRSHPLVLDINGDMITDFIVETAPGKRQLWTKYLSGSLQGSYPPELQPRNNQSMRFPNSNAFINLDPFENNTSADIFISGENKMEYWFNEQGFNNGRDLVIHEYPDNKFGSHRGQSAFVDVNSDGHIDHIMPVCVSEGLTCKEPQIVGYDSERKSWVVISNINYGNDSVLSFTQMETLGQTLPITIRHGDIDGDGYIDLITVMKTSDNRYIAVILKNTKANNTFGRQFVRDWTSDKHLSSGVDVEIAAFTDLFEDGKIDILMTTKDKSGKHSVEAVLNTQMIAACFLKVLVTSGLCYGASCPRGNIPYGTNQFGPFVCFQLQDLDGNWQTSCVGQLSQSGHSALQMPYSVFGLGETPNFVENVYASIPSGKMPNRHSKWTQIVPDAQVVLIPFPPNETSYWISKLFYTPSNIVFSTLITLASICCILVLIIGILHRKELLEDLAEHEEYKRHWPESR